MRDSPREQPVSIFVQQAEEHRNDRWRQRHIQCRIDRALERGPVHLAGVATQIERLLHGLQRAQHRSKGEKILHIDPLGGELLLPLSQLLEPLFVPRYAVASSGDHQYHHLPKVCGREAVDDAVMVGIIGVLCTAAFFELLRKKTQRERLHLR